MSAPQVSRSRTRSRWTFALGAEAVARTITRRPPRASLTEVRMARKKMFFDSSQGARANSDTFRVRSTTRSHARSNFFPAPYRRRTARVAGLSGLVAMHLLLSTIALRPYVFVFLACFLLHRDRQFRPAHDAALHRADLRRGARLRMEFGAQRLPFRPLSLLRGDARPRNLGRRRAVHGFALVHLSGLCELHGRAAGQRRRFIAAGSICGCSTPGSCDARRAYG